MGGAKARVCRVIRASTRMEVEKVAARPSGVFGLGGCRSEEQIRDEGAELLFGIDVDGSERE